MEDISSIIPKNDMVTDPFLYRGRVYQVEEQNEAYLIPQGSPFGDGVIARKNLIITNLNNNTALAISTLHSEMIWRYGFYEGQGTHFRLEPSLALKVFDFLQES